MRGPVFLFQLSYERGKGRTVLGFNLRVDLTTSTDIVLAWLRDVERNKTTSNMIPLEAAMRCELN